MGLTKAQRTERKQRIDADVAASLSRMDIVKSIVAGRKCPQCHAGLRRNITIAGWWQCEQFGNEIFRRDKAKPACNWQGFTQ